jgi:hypothetical protein
MTLATYLALDPATLAELAGAGLLRRASNDLDAGKVRVVDLAALQFEADGHQVSLDPRGWQQARCSCPAPAWCKHKLAAILCLQQQSPTAERAGEGAADTDGEAASDVGVVAEVAAASVPAADASLPADADSSSPPSASAGADPLTELLAEIDALDPASVLRLAGAAARRRLPRLLAQISAVHWQAHPGSLRIDLAGLAQSVRYLRHGGYAGMYSEGPAGARNALHLAALWALWRARGRDLPAQEVDSFAADGAENTDPVETLFSQVQAELGDWLADGLAQLSPISLDSLALLAIDARADSVPALSGRLRTLADWGRRLRARDDQVGEGEVLTAMAQCWAWCEAIGAANPEQRAQLAGGPRQFVEQRLDRSLLVAGAHWWQRPSGARGLSLLLWDGLEQRLRRCSLARGDASDRGFERQVAWSALPLWARLGSAERLVDAGSLDVRSARLSAGGDLASGEIEAAIGARWPVETELPVGIDDWRQLAGLMVGHDLFEPAQPYLLLAPSQCLPVELDELQQCLRWTLVDTHGRTLQARWPCPTDHETQLRLLEHLLARRGGGWRVLLAYGSEPQPQLQPVSLLLNEKGCWHCHPLQFSPVPKRAPVSALIGRISRMLAERRAPPVAEQHRLLSELLQPLREQLIRCASLGHSSPSDDTELARLGRRLDEAGLGLLAAAVADWRDASQRGLQPHGAMLKLVVLLEQASRMLQWRQIIGICIP